MSQCLQGLKSSSHFLQTAVAIRGIGGPVSVSVLQLLVPLITCGEQTKVSKHQPPSHPGGALSSVGGC